MYYELAPQMFSFLWGASFYGLLVLRYIYRDHLRDIWKWRAVTWTNLRPILVRWILACIGMYLFIAWYAPERAFGLILQEPLFVLFLCFAYPVLSALPQEFIFCSYFFERYRRLFGKGVSMIIASAVVFAYAHCLYLNPVAPSLSLMGGLIFATTYLKTYSLALVTIEHALYGNFLFVLGLGYYFYGGAVD
jgi:membrane protease YdiL (CAAX protease family)